MAILRKFATKHLGLTTDQFEVRSNLGGIAVSGEVTLHTDPLPGTHHGIYIQVSQWCASASNSTVLFRTCKSRRDYTGGANNLCNILVFATDVDMEAFAHTVFRVTGSKESADENCLA
ncbi:MAG: hypothetical protein EB060_12700 [Proteobacteria bacterium]|nr:hypothetical protein [Pseudomonadota bacterium]